MLTQHLADPPSIWGWHAWKLAVANVGTWPDCRQLRPAQGTSSHADFDDSSDANAAPGPQATFRSPNRLDVITSA